MINAILKSRIDEDISLMLSISNHKWFYLCDCGQASDLTIADCQNINVLFVSHTHIDHFSNFDTLLRHQLGIQRTITICGPKGIAKNVQSKILGYIWNLIQEGSLKYEVREITEEGTIQVYELEPPEWNLKFIGEESGSVIYENEAIRVDYTLLNHGTPTVAYLFQEPDKIKMNDLPFPGGKWVRELKDAYEMQDTERIIEISDSEKLPAKDLFQYIYVEKGYKLGYIMDFLADDSNKEKIIKLFEQADELFMESYYRETDKSYALLNHHSTAKFSGEVARMAKVKKANPIHHSRRYGEEIEDLREEFFAAFENREPIFQKEVVSKFV